MGDPRELSVDSFLDAVTDPRDPIASSVLAAQIVAAAAALLTMAARASTTPEASGLAAQAESVRARADALIVRCEQAFDEALRRLRERASGEGAGTERDFLFGRALHRAAEAPAAVAEAAGDVALLAEALAPGCEPDRLPDVHAACVFAEAAAAACVDLVAVNLVAGGDESLCAQARRGAELAVAARERLT